MEDLLGGNMNSITKQIFEEAQGLLTLTPEVRNEMSGFSMFNDGSVECEVGEFLYGLVRVLKPTYVLETGTYKGVASSYIGLALKENRKVRPMDLRGTLETLEIEDQHIQTSKTLWQKLGVNDVIIPYRVASLDYDPPHRYQLIFLDSEPNIRFAELVKFYKALEPGGYVFIHDLPPTFCQGNINPDHPEIQSYPFGNVPEEMKNLLKDKDLVPFHFPNPRGLVGFYRRKENDYQAL